MTRSQMKLGSTALAVFFGVLALGSPLLAVEPVATTRGNLAVKGYDPVAYFERSEAVKGDKRFSHEWNGAVWRFASAENRDLFAASPGKYAPQYGGYCAFAVSKGHTASSDPEAWMVYEGKLYLNYSKSVREKWRADLQANIAAANENWPKILAE